MANSAEDEKRINTIRFLAVDAVQKANSGHPGMPLGAAAAAYTLWSRHMQFDPAEPKWFNRDRFVLSAGHASALLYSLLHLFGYDLTLDDLKSFRQLGSRTPGHPEYHHTAGVEATTGPLGQGFGNAVGFAIAQAQIAATYSNGGSLFDHFTYVMAGDGDMMEGVASEAASLAGHLKLGKLICLYDDNKISLAAPTSVTFTEDVGKRFEAYGWHVAHIDETHANDVASIDAAIKKAQSESDRPSIILIHSIIGFASPRAARLPRMASRWAPTTSRRRKRSSAGRSNRRSSSPRTRARISTVAKRRAPKRTRHGMRDIRIGSVPTRIWPSNSNARATENCRPICPGPPSTRKTATSPHAMPAAS